MPRPSLPDFYKIIQPELFENMAKQKEKSHPPPATPIPGTKAREKKMGQGFLE